MIFFFFIEVFGFTPMLLNPNGILFFTKQFAQTFWVPSKTRDQKNAKKYLKNANISHFKKNKCKCCGYALH
jgi:hypothetical protein